MTGGPGNIAINANRSELLDPLVLIAIACAWQVRVLAVNILRKMKLIYQIICGLLVVNLRFTPRSTNI